MKKSKHWGLHLISLLNIKELIEYWGEQVVIDLIEKLISGKAENREVAYEIMDDLF